MRNNEVKSVVTHFQQSAQDFLRENKVIICKNGIIGDNKSDKVYQIIRFNTGLIYKAYNTMVKIKSRQNLRTLTLLHLYYVHIILISLFYCHFQNCAILQIPDFTDCLIAHHTIFIPYDTFWSDKVSSKQGGQFTEFYL